MRSTRIIQIGDVHYPDAKANARAVDWKDPSISKSLGTLAAPNGLQAILRQILREAGDNPSTRPALLVCGDLTDYGERSGYEECARTLCATLDLSNPNEWHPDLLHIVPGNHDIYRDDINPGDPNRIYDKFAPLQAIWSALGLPILTSDTLRHTQLTRDGCSVDIFSLNSCLGCGEYRGFPEQIRNDIIRLLEQYKGSVSQPEAFTLIGEQLDTPAFVAEHIEELQHCIGEIQDTSLGVVLAHHNILPQALPRYDLYTELLNAGLARARLTSVKAPLLYLHGHIHEDPVEIVRDAHHPDGALVVISAPKLTKGFNVIDIEYSRRSARPVGCIITQYRIQRHQGISADPPVRVSLATSLDREDSFDEPLKLALQAATSSRQRFSHFRDYLHAQGTRKFQTSTIADALREAEWFGFLSINNRAEPCELWQIQGCLP